MSNVWICIKSSYNENKINFMLFTITPPQNLTGEQLISLQSHMVLTTGNKIIDIDNV